MSLIPYPFHLVDNTIPRKITNNNNNNNNKLGSVESIYKHGFFDNTSLLKVDVNHPWIDIEILIIFKSAQAAYFFPFINRRIPSFIPFCRLWLNAIAIPLNMGLGNKGNRHAGYSFP